MPKMKTNRGAAKRFKFTGSGKVKRSKAAHRHILTKKTTKRKRGPRPAGISEGADMREPRKLLPYG